MYKALQLVLEDANNSEQSSTEKLTETLKNMVKSPVFYIVIGCIILLIIVVYLLRRIVKPSSNVINVVVRGGKIHKLIDEKSKNYFMVPFKDSLAASISLNEKELNSDKLFINNGPDALYQINYSLRYKVVDVEKFFKYRDNFQNVIVNQINEELRNYSDKGHVQEIIKDYREHSKDLLKLLNEFSSEYGVEAVEFKVYYIQPLGKK